jgi:hypothetical protein
MDWMRMNCPWNKSECQACEEQTEDSKRQDKGNKKIATQNYKNVALGATEPLSRGCADECALPCIAACPPLQPRTSHGSPSGWVVCLDMPTSLQIL